MPAPAPRAVVVAVVAALVAALLPSAAGAAAAAAPGAPAAALPAPTLSPATVAAGGTTTVSGARCRPGTPPTNVDVTVRQGTSRYVAYRSTTPGADGRWSVTLTVDAGAASGTYSVDARCFANQQYTSYPSVPLTVTAAAGAPWTGQTPALPNVPNGTVADVSCVSATRCVAVGDGTVAGTGRPFVQTWDGAAWTLVALPAQLFPDYAYLAGVSCAAADRCVAVGEGDASDGAATRPFVLSLRGTAWTSTSLPAPPGKAGAALSDVSCPGIDTCTAVGTAGYVREGSDLDPAAYTLSGTTWTVTAPVGLGDQSQLSAVSCPAAGSCLAVGNSIFADPGRPFAETFDGAAWHAVDLPAPAGGDTVFLGDVACAGPSSCVAVGGRQDASDPFGVRRPAVAEYDGTSWTYAPVALTDPSAGGTLAAVSCPVAGRCTAVGSSTGPSPAYARSPIAVDRGAAGWSGGAVPVGADSLAGVSCVGATWCLAVGSHAGLPAAAVRPRARWSDTAVPTPPGYLGGEFDAVACAAADACVAVGSSTTVDYRSTPLVNRWNGTRWLLQTTPSLSATTLTGVACPAVTRCFGVGTTTTGTTGTVSPVLLTSTGGAWRQLTLPLPAGGTATLRAVSCSAATACLAVGSTATYGGTPLAYALAADRWTLTPAPPVDPALTSPGLTGVSCTVDGTCRVVGQGYRSTGGTTTPVGVDLVWDGSAWSPGSALGPAVAVSCAAATACAAALQDFSARDAQVAVFDGASWTAEPLPSPTEYSTTVSAVACRAGLVCTAAGGSTSGAYVARRTDAGWVQQPVPAGVGGYRLNGVACPTDTRCVAVGQGQVPTVVVSPGA